MSWCSLMLLWCSMAHPVQSNLITVTRETSPACLLASLCNVLLPPLFPLPLCAVLTSFKAHPAVLKASDSTSRGSTAPSKLAAAAYIAPAASGRYSFRLPKRDVEQRFILESTQPFVKANGMMRWALNSVAHSATPPCRPVLDNVHADARWAAANSVKGGGST